MTRFTIVDLSNLFHRARHSTMGDPEMKIGLALSIVFRSLRKLYRELKTDHIVFAIDGGSWRGGVYPAYKSRRKLERLQATPKEQHENEMFFASLNALITYLDEHTHCTVLKATGIEGDDFVARWIDRHPNDEHIIVSGDSDFVQLLSSNVHIYDAINQRMIGIDKIVDYKNNALEFSVNPKDGKIKVGKPNDNFVPELDWWKKALFIKLIRGDVGDSVFSAFPGVRYEGKKHSIKSAWEDRNEKCYDWNNLMFQTWDKLIKVEDGEKITETVRVIDEFRINEGLIDLHKQPGYIVATMDEEIDRAVLKKKNASGVAMQFLKFCRAYDLENLDKESSDHVTYLNASYPGTQ